MRDGSRIVNFSSSVIGIYQPSYAVYAATKAGVEAMTQRANPACQWRNHLSHTSNSSKEQVMSKQIILVTGASSGFGLQTAKALAQAGHTVYASMREIATRNAPQVAALADWSKTEGLDLRSVELDVQADSSVASGISHILSDAGRLDVIVHNAGHMVFGPMVPGAFTKGTNHFAHAGKPSDEKRVAEYESGPYAGIAEQALKGLASLEPADADPSAVAREIVRVVNMPFGKRPFRVHVDPSQDGAEVVNAVADRMRREMYRNIGLVDLLSPRSNG
jgi:hypothetical protein